MPTLVIIRHGQSEWNLQNRFTGWVDVDLSPNGVNEAQKAGEKLDGYHFDYAFSSVLKRANRTMEIVLDKIGQADLHMERNEALNERMYGELQGMNKDEARKEFGEEQVHIWRRSYDVPPPGGESLKDTRERVLPYFEKHIQPLIEEDKNIIITAHGNSLRALVMYLEKMTPEEILKTEIPTGTPIVYTLDPKLSVLDKKILE
jgi:2,3-bisphosphoglycerate-dependent phosphoglycerate mutase